MEQIPQEPVISISNPPQSLLKKFFSDKRNVYSLIGILILGVGISFYFFEKNRIAKEQISEESRALTEVEKKILFDLEQNPKPKYQDILKVQAQLKASAEKSPTIEKGTDIDAFLKKNSDAK